MRRFVEDKAIKPNINDKIEMYSLHWSFSPKFGHYSYHWSEWPSSNSNFRLSISKTTKSFHTIFQKQGYFTRYEYRAITKFLYTALCLTVWKKHTLSLRRSYEIECKVLLQWRKFLQIFLEFPHILFGIPQTIPILFQRNIIFEKFSKHSQKFFNSFIKFSQRYLKFSLNFFQAFSKFFFKLFKNFCRNFTQKIWKLQKKIKYFWNVKKIFRKLWRMFRKYVKTEKNVQ